MKETLLTRGKVALVDDADFDWLDQWKWHAIKGPRTFYACRTDRSGSKKRSVYMHAEIFGPSPDHKDGDGLNNQRHNLRAASPSQQIANCRKREGCSSQFKGVSHVGRKWIAQIVGQYLGSSASEADAAQAYDIAARIKFGEFARVKYAV